MTVSGRRCPLTALCPQYEQTLPVLAEPDPRQELRAQIRKNITETLVSLRVNTVDDIQQVAAALAQCTVGQTQPHSSPAPHTPAPHTPRAPFLAKPARLHAPRAAPRALGTRSTRGGRVGGWEARSGDAVLCSTPGLWSPPRCPGVSGQAGLGSVLMGAWCQGRPVAVAEASGG